MLQLLSHLGTGGDAAIDANAEVWKFGFKLVHHRVTQRRHLAVGFGRQTLEPGVARMDDEGLATGFTDGPHKIAHEGVTLGFVDANAVLHGDWHLARVHHIQHRLHAIGHQLGLGHQARAKSAALDALAGATAVQVDLVIAPLLAQPGGLRQLVRIAAPQLQCKRVFFNIELKVPRNVAMQQGTGRHHLGVQQRVA